MSNSLSFLSPLLRYGNFPIEAIAIAATAIYHQIASYRDRRYIAPPGNLVIASNGKNRHFQVKGSGDLTIVVDSSLGGVEGYLLIDELAKLTSVCIYDRSGYGWSDLDRKSRNSSQIIDELHELLTLAQIPPPYILIGDSFGSYNLRLFSHRYPDLVAGLVLTDGLHEESMLSLPMSVGLLKAFFTFSFGFVAIWAALGIVRILGNLGVFELIKPELKKFPKVDRNRTKRSFYFARHWLTMAREMWNLDASGNQLKLSNNLGDLPIVSIKAQTFLRPVLGIPFLSLPAADRTRDRIHRDLMRLSTQTHQISASKSSHFVWIDEPELIIKAAKMLVDRLSGKKL